MQKANLFEIIGDSLSAKLNFEKSLSICNSVLDTMHETNNDYLMLVTNKAINLIMLGDSTSANKILKVLYDKQPYDPAYDNIEKKFIKVDFEDINNDFNKIYNVGDILSEFNVKSWDCIAEINKKKQ